MRMLKYYFSVLLFLTLLSCSHDNEETFVPDATITITSPVENSVIRFGDTVFVLGTIQSSSEIQAYEVAIRREGGPDLYFQHFHAPGNTLLVNEKWKNDLTTPANMEVEVYAILDEQLHKKSKKVRFQINN